MLYGYIIAVFTVVLMMRAAVLSVYKKYTKSYMNNSIPYKCPKIEKAKEKNQVLRQMQLKFDNLQKLGIDVEEPEVFVEEFIEKLSCCGIRLQSIWTVSRVLTILPVLTAVIWNMMPYGNGLEKTTVLSTSLAMFAISAYMDFFADVSSQKRRLCKAAAGVLEKGRVRKNTEEGEEKESKEALNQDDIEKRESEQGTNQEAGAGMKVIENIKEKGHPLGKTEYETDIKAEEEKRKILSKEGYDAGAKGEESIAETVIDEILRDFFGFE